MASFFDTNKDGKITKEDISNLVEKNTGKKGFIPKFASKIIFKALDKNGDGKLDGDEALGLFKNMTDKDKNKKNEPEATNVETNVSKGKYKCNGDECWYEEEDDDHSAQPPQKPTTPSSKSNNFKKELLEKHSKNKYY